MTAGFQRILIVGMGLIGGSFAGALRELAHAPEIIGTDICGGAVDEALRLGIVDRGLVAMEDDSDSLERLLRDGVDLILLAIPVEAYPDWFRLFAKVGYDGVVTDTGSTKEPAIAAAETYLPKPDYFVPGHPMAGSEAGGLGGARKDLFAGAYWILTPTQHTDIHIFRRLHTLLTAVGARVISVDPAEHDRVTAIVSHVPHIAAAALVTLAGNHIGEKGDLLRLAAGGFRDTTRVAAGNPALWKGILLDNRLLIAEELDEYIRILSDFREIIAGGDEEIIYAMLDSAANIRRNIPAKWVPESAKLIRVRIPMGNRPGIIADITSAAGRTGCNIQAIDIDHQTEKRAVLELVLTDEGNMETFATVLKEAGFVAYFDEVM